MNVIDESSSAFDPSERGERPLSAVPGVVQQKSPRFALSFAVALDVGPSPPTPSLTRDIPFSSPMTKSNHDAKGSKSRSKKESNNDRNYIADGDTALSKTPLKTKSDAAAADDDAATSVERIVNAAESREASSRESSLANGTKKTNENFNGCGPFTASELSQLSLLRPERWSVLDQDLVVSLTSMLQVHVAAGVGIDLVSEGRSVVLRGMEVGRGPVISVQQWMMQTAKYSGPNSAPLGSLGEAKLEPGAGYRRLQILIGSLEAASILLGIMSCHGIDRRAVEDDAIERCVNLIKNHIQKHIIPSLSNTGHLGAPMPGISASDSEEDSVREARPTEPVISPKPAKKTRKTLTPDRNDLSKTMKAVYIPILSTTGLFITFLERSDAFVVANEMDDRLLFTLSAAALSTLSIDASSLVRADTTSLTSIIQASSLNLVVSIFRRYPRHRSIIIEDLFPLMLKLPTSKRSMRTFLVKRCRGSQANDAASAKADTISSICVGDTGYIQPICALILLFVQACVTMPFQSDDVSQQCEADEEDKDEEDKDEEDSGKDQEKHNSRANDTSGLDGCVAICNQITAQLVLRCSRKGNEGGASEFRPVLHNLIDDLLLVRDLPEYPAAEVLLLYLSSRLGNDLLRASSAPKNAQVEVTYLSTAMDAFGKITSAVASCLLQYRENPFQQLPETLSPSEFEPREEVNRCFCGRDNLDTFMVDCDRCHSWFHGSCIGITKDTVPELWFCDDCKLLIAISDQAKVFARPSGESTSLTTFDRSHALRQLLLHHLTQNVECTGSPQAKSAREFMIATWVKSLTLAKEHPDQSAGTFDLDLVRSHVIAQWSLETVQKNDTQQFQLSSYGLERIMKSLVATSELSTSMPKLVGVLLRLMSDEMASLRKLSVKAILQVVNADPSLMSNLSVRKEVSRCFHDHAISVREAAVSLVGDYVIQTPSLASAFHTPLLERIIDRGVSVRKRIVKTFRDILLANPTYRGRATAMNCMLQRAADRKEDDGVRDLIFDSFYTLWFDSAAFNVSVANLSATASESTPKHPQAGIKAELYCREAAEQMVEVVKVSGSADDLTCLVKGLLFGFGDGDKDKKVAERQRRQHDARNQCKNLVSSLFEILLRFEETRVNEENDGRDLVAILSTLGVFSQAYPELLVSHVDTIVPYLKGDNGAQRYEAQIVRTVSSIITRTAPNFTLEELVRLTNGELPSDLVNIAYKFPSDAVSSAIEALCTLSNHHHATPESIQQKKLHTLSVQFYSYLLKTADATDATAKKKSVKDNVKRALSALGSVCRFFVHKDSTDHYSIDPNIFSFISDTSQLQFAENAFSNACFSIFLKYLNKDDEATKCLALRAMTGVFISRPRVVLAAEQMGIIAEVMSEKAPASVQLETLRCWRDILLAEETRIESGEAMTKMAAQKNITVSKRISGDQDGDSCISGSVLTRHASRLYEMTLSKEEKIRHMIVELIGHLLRQGLINPMETVPYLLAMQGDIKSPSTRSLALKLLINEGEKRPDMLNQRIQAGVKRAFNFQQIVYPHDNEKNTLHVTALLESKSEGDRVRIETIFDEVIKESSIRNKKAQRQGLYKSIIGMFEKEVSHDSSLTKTFVPKRHEANHLRLLAFAAQILAHLPYNCTADPLFIVYHASCITALEGNELLVRFAELLGNDVCDPNASEDELEKCAKLNDPKNSAFASRLQSNSNFNAAEFGFLCEKACGLNLLLNLKNFLRKAYNLSEARITEYLPSEKERINERGISISEGTPKFCAHVIPIFEPLPGANNGYRIDWNTAIRTYALFRTLMREGDLESNLLQFDEGNTKRGSKRKRSDVKVENSPGRPLASSQAITQEVSPD